MKDIKENENGLVIKWGNELYEDGISNAPQCLMRYSRRFVKATHFQLIACIISYQYGADAPFPSQQKIADDMGISKRRVQTLLEELEAEGLLDVSFRYIDGKRSSNEYNFAPLLNKCLAYSYSLRAEKEKNVVKVKKKTKRTKCSPSNEISLNEQSVHVGVEQSVHQGVEQSVHQGSEQSVHSKKEREERKERMEEKKVCVIPEEEKRILDLISTREDLKTHTNELTKILNSKKKNKTFKYEVFEKTLEIIDLDIKSFKYLETALMNNLKKGYVEDFKTPPSIEQKDPALYPYGPKQVIPLPKWFKDINKSPEEWQAEQEQDDTDYAAERKRILEKLGSS